MATSSISAATLSQYELTTSNPNQLQQTVEALQDGVAAGDLTSAQSAFQTLQQQIQQLSDADGVNYSNSQLSNDLASLGSALTAGDLTTAQSAFATVQSDLKNAASPTQTLEANLAAQSEELVQDLLSPLSTDPTNGTSSATGSTDSLITNVYAARSALNTFA